MISKAYYVVVGFILIVTLFACELFETGLGEQVDLKAPEITFDSPANGEYVNGTITLQGTATDEIEVASVSISYTSPVTGETVTEDSTYSDPNWYFDVDTSDFSDGELEFSATVTDTADKTTTKTSYFYIDNTIPTVLVNSPGSDEIDVVNGSLTIKGEADDLKLSQVEVYLISATDSSEVYGGVADGTSSWSYEIDTVSEGIGDSSSEEFYLMVEAYDKSGNSNTYFYWNDDLGTIKSSLGVNSVTLDDLTDKDNTSIVNDIQRDSSSNKLYVTVDQDEDSPKFLDLEEWYYDDSLDGFTSFYSDAYIYGRVTDDDGIETITVSVYKESDDTLVRKGTISPSGDTDFSLEIAIEATQWSSNTSYSWVMDESIDGYNDDLPESSYYFEIVADDVNYGTDEEVDTSRAVLEDTGASADSFSGHFGIDKTAPVVEITSIVNTLTGEETVNPDSYGSSINSGFTISGTAVDEVYLSRILVTVSADDSDFDTTATITPSDSNFNEETGEWSYSVDLEDSDGNKYTGDLVINVTAYDADEDDDNAKSDYDELSIYVDQIIPTIDAIYFPENINGTIEISGKATDKQLDYIEYQINGYDAVVVEPEGSSWSFELDTIDLYSSESAYNEDLTNSDSATNSETHSFNVWAYDESGNKSKDLSEYTEADDGIDFSSYTTLTILPSSDLPEASFDSATNKYTTSSAITGSATDDDGISSDETSVQVTIYDSNGDEIDTLNTTQSYNNVTVIGWTTVYLDEFSTGLSGTTYYDGLPEGVYSYTVSVTDTHTDTDDEDRTYTSSEIAFTVDNGAPTLTETTIGSSSVVYMNSSVSFTGIVSDGTGISSFMVSENGSDSDISGNITDNTWSYDFIVVDDTESEDYTEDGDYEFVFSATDNSSILVDDRETSTIRRNIVIDRVGPSISPNFSSGDKSTTSPVTLDGRISDYSSGLDSDATITATYSFNGGSDEDPITVDINDGEWEFDIEFESEGYVEIVLTAEDVLGNSTSTESITLYYDISAPTLEETTVGTPDTQYTSDEIVFGGTVSDTNFLSTLEVSIDNGSSYTDISGNITDENWTYTFDADIDGNGTVDADEEGEYSIIFIATDIADKTTTVYRTGFIDIYAPTTLTFDDLDSDNTESETYLTGSITVSGTAADTSGGSGIASVEYKFTTATEWEIATGRNDWLNSIDLSSLTEDQVEIEVRTTDYAGNVSSIVSQSFHIDHNAPVVTMSHTATDNKSTGDVTFSGESSDSYQLASTILYYLNNTTADTVETEVTITPDSTDNSWSWMIDTSTMSDGEYDVRIVATDDAGKQDEESATVTVDTTAPVLNIADNSAGYYESSFYVSGTSTDNISGVSSVEYSWDYTDDDNSDNDTWISDELSGTGNWYGDLDITSLSLGDNILYMRTTDSFGNVSDIYSRAFIRDTQVPTTGLTLSEWTNTTYKDSSFTLSATASDDNTIASVTVSGDGLASDFSETTDFEPWSVTIDPTTLDQGEKTLTVTVTDSSGRSTVETVTYFFDNEQPTPVINDLDSSNIESDTYLTGTISIGGTASDTTEGSGIASVEYKLNSDSVWTTASGTESWISSIDLTAKSEASVLLQVRTTDNAGKVSDTVTQGFHIDHNDPEVTITHDASDSESNSDVTFSGTSLDSYALDSTILYYSIDGADEVSVTIAPDADDEWEWLLDVSEAAYTDGEYDVRIVATDDAGKTDEANITVTVDTTAPVLDIFTNSSDYYEDSFYVSGTSTDNISGVASVEYSWDYTDDSDDANDTWLNDGDAGYELSGTGYWYGNLDITSLTSGDNTIYMRTTDNFGNVSAVSSRVFTRDTLEPSTGLTLTDWTTTTYKDSSFTLSATASDDNGIASVVVSGDGLATNYSGTDAVWSTTITPTDQGESTLTITVTDSVGRPTEENINYFYDNSIPVVAYTNITDGDTVGSSSYTVVGEATDIDGSGVTLVEYRYKDDSSTAFTDDDWTTATGTSIWSFQLTDLIDSDEHTIEVRATDASGKVSNVSTLDFTVDTKIPEINGIYADRTSDYDFADKVTVSTNQYYGGDLGQFHLQLEVYDSIGIDSVIVNIPDYNSGNDISLSYDSTEGSNNYQYWSTDSLIDVTSLSDGSSIWTFTVTDDSGLETTTTREIQIDNTVPSITYSYPGNMDDIVNGEVESKGFGEDSGSGLSTVEFKVGYTPENESWTSVDGSPYSWEIPFTDDGIGKIDNYAGLEVSSVDTSANTITLSSHGYTDDIPLWIGDDDATTTTAYGLSNSTTYYVIYVDDDTFQLSESEGGSAVSLSADTETLRVSKYSKDSDGDTIWELPVIVTAADEVGNDYLGYNSGSTTYDYIIYADPSGDKPNVSIVYPDPEDSNRTMGGIIRIFGTATDDDGVDSVYMQIDVDGDGDYDTDDVATDDDNTDWYNAGEGQVIDGTASWNRSINTEGEFNSTTSGETNTINFRVRVKDIYGTYGPWTDSQQIIVDNDVPTIGSSEPAVLIDSSDSEKTYVADMWISDAWTLYASIEDESDISRIVVESDDITDLNFDLSGDSEILAHEYDSGDGVGWFEDYSNTDNGTTGYLMSLPFDTTLLTGSSFDITVTAYDDSSEQSSSSSTFSINFDNTAPTMGDYDGTTPIEQSNYSYEVSSTITKEDGSGLERVAFYFLRESGDGDRVYNPLERGYDSGSGDYYDITDAERITYTSTLDMTGELPRLVVTDDNVERTSEYSLTDSDLIAGNYNVRVGGLIKVGGLDRLITDVDYTDGIVTWADAVDVSETTAYIAYASIVDNFTIETPVWSNNYMTSITNDDGDFMVESIEQSGGYYEWSASIDSLNIPDGVIKIYWVAYDNSGNYTSDFIETQILNNRPKLAKVTLGSDLDGDGTVVGAGNDGITDYTGLEYEVESAYSLLDGSGDNQAVAEAGSRSFTTKDMATIDIEVVGGNGELQYEIGTGYSESDSIYNTTNNIISLTTLRADGSSSIETIELTLAQFEAIGDTGTDSNYDSDLDSYYDNFYIKIWDSTEETTIGTDSQWAFLTLPMVIDVVDEVAPTASVSDLYWTSDSDNSLYDNSSANGHIEVTGVYDGSDPDVSGKISLRGTAYDDQRIDELYIYIDDMTMTGTDTNTVTADYSDGIDTETYKQVATYSAGIWSVVDEWSDEGWSFSITSSIIDQSGHSVEWQLDWDTSEITGVAGLNKEIKVVAVDKNPNNNTADVYSVDVVPYITDVTTGLEDGTKSFLKRSATGSYTINNSNSEDIVITGFNIYPSTNGIEIGSNTYTGTNQTDTTSISIDKSTISGSGSIAVTTNSVDSINNINSNSADYNTEPSTYNLYQTDDRYVHVWDIDTTAYETKTEAVMTPEYNTSGQKTGDMSWMYVDNSKEVYMNNQRLTNSWNIMGGDFAYNSDGTPMYIYLHNMNWQSGDDSYDAHGSVQWGKDEEYEIAAYNWHRAAYDTLGLGNLSFDSDDNYPGYSDVVMARYENLNIKLTGDDTQTTNFVTYFDNASESRSIVFWSFNVGTGSSFTQETDLSTGWYSDLTKEVGSTQWYGNSYDVGYQTPANRVEVTSSSEDSEYFDTYYDEDRDNMILAYYDETNSILKVRYNNDPINDGSAWSDAFEVDTSAGQYVKTIVDSSGNIHLAYYDGTGSYLKYAMLTPTLSSGDITGLTLTTQVVVDALFTNGMYNSIGLKKFDTDDIRPVISTYSIAYGGTDYALRVSWPLDPVGSISAGAETDTGSYTGNWEVVSVCSDNAPSQDYTFINTNEDISNSEEEFSGNIVVGYNSDYIEEAILLD